jgi:hypothetical protein
MLDPDYIAANAILSVSERTGQIQGFTYDGATIDVPNPREEWGTPQNPGYTPVHAAALAMSAAGMSREGAHGSLRTQEFPRLGQALDRAYVSMGMTSEAMSARKVAHAYGIGKLLVAENVALTARNLELPAADPTLTTALRNLSSGLSESKMDETLQLRLKLFREQIQRLDSTPGELITFSQLHGYLQLQSRTLWKPASAHTSESDSRLAQTPQHQNTNGAATSENLVADHKIKQFTVGNYTFAVDFKGKIPLMQACVFAMRVQGMEEGQIAQTLVRSIQTVKSHAKRARSGLGYDGLTSRRTIGHALADGYITPMAAVQPNKVPSQKQLEALHAAAGSLNIEDAAKNLRINPSTYKKRLRDCSEILGCNNTDQALLISFTLGLIPLPEKLVEEPSAVPQQEVDTSA